MDKEMLTTILYRTMTIRNISSSSEKAGLALLGEAAVLFGLISSTK